MQTAVRRRLYGFIIQRVKSMFFSKSFCLQSRRYADRGVILVEFFCSRKRIFSRAQWRILLCRQGFRTFQMEFEFPLLFWSSKRTCSISAIRISRLTSWQKKRYAFQWSWSFVLIALLCRLSRVLVSSRILVVMYGLGLDLIFTRRFGACSLSTFKNRGLKT